MTSRLYIEWTYKYIEHKIEHKINAMLLRFSFSWVSTWSGNPFQNLFRVLWADIRWCNMSDNISECPISSFVRIYISNILKYSKMFRACSYDGIFYFYVTRGILSEISFEVIFTSSDVQNHRTSLSGFNKSVLIQFGVNRTEISHTYVKHDR